MRRTDQHPFRYFVLNMASPALMQVYVMRSQNIPSPAIAAVNTRDFLTLLPASFHFPTSENADENAFRKKSRMGEDDKILRSGTYLNFSCTFENKWH